MLAVQLTAALAGFTLTTQADRDNVFVCVNVYWIAYVSF